MVDYLVLGLLMYRPLTMYEIKKAMEKSTEHFFSASFGSLHPALKKLDEKGWVTFTQTLEQGRGKKTYAITEAGQAAFLEWLQQDASSQQTTGSQQKAGTEKVREPSLLKMFFLGHLSEEDRAPVLEHYLTEVEKSLVQLKGVLEVSQAMQVSDAQLAHKTYQLATLEFGIAYYEFVKAWYEKKFPAVKD
jgi:DNA-binding PadR family transcriptional regulator